MKREEMIEALERHSGYWDVIIVGGGATGLGTAVDAAARGCKTLLLEQHDFAKATSSRSTKLIHGGVRYLRQGNISLVLEALHERGLLIQNAPHLVSNQAFLVPNYVWWDGPFYGAGMKVYDFLAGKLGFGPSRRLSRQETLERIPTLEPKDLRGGVIYHDGQFDDARLAVNLAQTIADLGGVPVNYMKVDGLIKKGDIINGVAATDMETGRSYLIHSRVVINATGVFTDSVRRMDDPEAKSIVTASQGVHLILPSEFLPGETAVMVPQTDDGRVLFAVPWHNAVLVGTTDTPVAEISLEPRALEEEVEFILKHAAKYLNKDPRCGDVLSVFAGLRSLAASGRRQSTASLARDHLIVVSRSGLVTVTGGKWTTYRKMAEEAVDQALLVAGLERRPCVTSHLPIHGWVDVVDGTDPLHSYGSDSPSIRKLVGDNPVMGKRIHDDLPYIHAEVAWSVRNEMARTVEDVLARRTRALLLNARASMEAAPCAAAIMAAELGRDCDWERDQVRAYLELAVGYVLDREPDSAHREDYVAHVDESVKPLAHQGKSTG
jgi:glycerol-3-phosphate dehydrogenase